MPFGILALTSKRSLSIHEGPAICASLTSYARAIRSRRVMLLSVTRPGFLAPPTAIWPSVGGGDCLMVASSNAGGVPVWAANVYTERSAVVRMRILVLRRFLIRVDDQYVERRFAGIQLQVELLQGRKDRGRRSAGLWSTPSIASALVHHHHATAYHALHAWHIFHGNPQADVVPAFEVGHVNEDGLLLRQSIAPEDRRGVGRRGSPDRDARRDQADSGNHSDCGGRARESGAGAIQ